MLADEVLAVRGQFSAPLAISSGSTVYKGNNNSCRLVHVTNGLNSDYLVSTVVDWRSNCLGGSGFHIGYKCLIGVHFYTMLLQKY